MAVFLWHEDAVLWIDGHQYPLLDPLLRVEIGSRPFMPVRTVSVALDGHPAFKEYYWFVSDDAWPDDGDLFSYALRAVERRPRDGGERTLLFLRALQSGEDITSPEFLKRLR
jgi:hypothetical protein